MQKLSFGVISNTPYHRVRFGASGGGGGFEVFQR